MISSKSGRLFVVAAALAVTFSLALPAEAADGRGSSPGVLEQVITWMTGGWNGWMPTTQADEKPGSNNNDGGHLDPNGGPRNGACLGDGGCNQDPPASNQTEGRP